MVSPTKSKPAAVNGEQDVDKARILPEDYQPNEELTVVIGRGRKILERKGNQRLCRIVLAKLPAYAVLGCKNKKSAILVDIVNQIKDSNPDNVGFAKFDTATKRWYEVSMRAARTTVAQAFRDTNHKNYRSSKQSKQRRRRQKKQIARTVSGCGELEPATGTTSLTLRDAIHHDRVLSSSGAEATVGSNNLRPSIPSLDSFPTSFPCLSEPRSRSPRDPMLRLHNLLDEAVRCTNPTKKEDEDMVTSSDSWYQDVPLSSILEPVPIAAAFDEFTVSDEEDEEDLFQVFDMYSVADIRAALSA